MEEICTRWTMNRPSQRALRQWWADQPARDRTCTDCGRTGPQAYIQPQHPYYAQGREGTARCAECITAANARIRAEHKAKLALAPRCEVAGCAARGTWRFLAGGLLLCGRHRNALKRNHERTLATSGLFLSGMIGSATYTRD